MLQSSFFAKLNMPKIYPPLYMLTYGFIMWLNAKYLPIYSFASLVDLQWLAYLLAILGLMLDLVALRLFYMAKTTFHPLKIDQTNSLVTTGIYKFSRNPMYLGLLLLLIAWAIILAALSPLIMLPSFVWWLNRIQIKPEETILATKFGQIYLDYKNRVRRWI